MLGKTNITTLSEGAIVTEVEDFKWIQMQSGVYGNFVKAIYKNDYLVAITADGTVVYTTDGEVWQTSVLEYEDCKLNDIEWDGSRFILVGSHTTTIEEIESTFGLILTTDDFSNFSKISMKSEDDQYGTNTYYDQEYCAVHTKNGRYYILACRYKNRTISMHLYESNLTDIWTRIDINIRGINSGTVLVAKNSSEMLICFNASEYSASTYNYHNCVYKVNGANIVRVKLLKEKSTNVPMVFAVECKDTLYYMSALALDNYEFAKISEAAEVFSISTGKNYAFKSGVYFNSCELFINNHDMLIVKKGESIADKTLDDLIEIAPELTMNCITKAFGQLYIFGNQGAILKSSVETNNENAITVQTISAKKALSDAKQYTDEQYAILEARIAALEGVTTE